MGLPGYYLSDVLDLNTFPVAERYGGMSVGWKEYDIVHETERAKKWVYKQASHKTRKLVFILTPAQLDFFDILHQAVGGQETAFYFVPDVDDPDTSIYVRKEQNFDPKERDEPGMVEGVLTTLYDYTLELEQEPTDDEIGAAPEVATPLPVIDGISPTLLDLTINPVNSIFIFARNVDADTVVSGQFPTPDSLAVLDQHDDGDYGTPGQAGNTWSIEVELDLTTQLGSNGQGVLKLTTVDGLVATVNYAIKGT